jgi:hypothetical protein
MPHSLWKWGWGWEAVEKILVSPSPGLFLSQVETKPALASDDGLAQWLRPKLS